MNKSNSNVLELGYSTESQKNITKTCFERKKVGMQRLKCWDEDTKHNLEVSKNFIEDLFQRIEFTLAQSLKRYNSIYTFFDSFIITLKSQIVLREKIELFRMNINESGDIGSNVRSADLKEREPMVFVMVEFNREYELFNKKLETAMEKVSLEVNAKIMSNQVKPYQDNMKSLYSKVSSLRKELLKCSNKTIYKLKKLIKSNQVSMTDNGKGKRTKTNTFDYACEFVQSVKSVDTAITDYGLLLIAIWEQCTILEEKRISSMKQAFLKFLDILNEIFGAEAQRSFQNR